MMIKVGRWMVLTEEEVYWARLKGAKDFSQIALWKSHLTKQINSSQEISW